MVERDNGDRGNGLIFHFIWSHLVKCCYLQLYVSSASLESYRTVSSLEKRQTLAFG